MKKMLFVVLLFIASAAHAADFQLDDGQYLNAPHAPHAPSVSEVFQQFGLIGTWAVDCSQPASVDNAYGTYRAAGTLFYDFGPKYESRTWTYTVAFFSKVTTINVSFNALTLFGKLPDGSTADFVLRKFNGKIQNFQMIQGDGTIRIKDGVYTSNGKEAAWLELCHG